MVLIKTMRMVLNIRVEEKGRLLARLGENRGNFKNLQNLKNFGENFKNFLINYETIAKTHIHPIVNENHYQ